MVTRLLSLFDEPLAFLVLGGILGGIYSGIWAWFILYSGREDALHTKIEGIGQEDINGG